MLRQELALARKESGTLRTALDQSSRPVRSPELEDKMTASLGTSTQLQEENTRLGADLERTRSENAALTAQLKPIVASNDQAQAALALLDAELLAQKEARTRAEQETAAVRAQLSNALAQVPAAGPPRGPAGGKPVATAVAKAPGRVIRVRGIAHQPKQAQWLGGHGRNESNPRQAAGRPPPRGAKRRNAPEHRPPLLQRFRSLAFPP